MNDNILGYTFDEIKEWQQGRPPTRKVKINPATDHGFDPVGDGKVRMVPSGRVVTVEEAKQILGR